MSANYLRLIQRDTRGPRCDVTPLFADAGAFAAVLADLEQQLAGGTFDLVAGIDALGFILGTALAIRAGTGFLPIRKVGKLAVEADVERFTDYSGEEKGLELRTGALTPGTRVLLADEWIETGAQVRAAIRLIERQGGRIAGIVTIHVDVSPQTRDLLLAYSCFAAEREEASPHCGST
ncbi:MAG: adenine phosphoribosyltransferase [Chloroflexi bacterium]|nr:adenine phosphoribosyltransferase [Chloroflexota bacterium]